MRDGQEVWWLDSYVVAALTESNLVVSPAAPLKRYHPYEQRRSRGARFFGREEGIFRARSVPGALTQAVMARAFGAGLALGWVL